MKKIKFLIVCILVALFSNFAQSQTLSITPRSAFTAPGAQYIAVKNLGGTALSDIAVGYKNQVTVYITDTILASGLNTWTNVVSYQVGTSSIMGIALATGTVNNNIYVASTGTKNKRNSIVTNTMVNNGSGAFTVTPNTTYTAGFNSPNGFAYADFNADAANDFMFGSAISSACYLVTGTLAPQAVPTETPTQFHAINAVVGFSVGTGNTVTDLIIARNRLFGISIMTQTTTPGVFNAPVYYGFGEKYSAIAVGDITGDGIADIIATDYENALIVIWKGAANESFTKLQSIQCGLNPQGVAIGNFGGGSKIDIAVLEYATGRVQTYIQN